MRMQPKDSVDELIGVLILRRKMLKMSTAQLATKLGMDRETVSRFENGVWDAPLRFLLEYAHEVDMDLQWTLKGQR